MDIACEGAAQLREVINLNADAPSPLTVLRTRCDRPSRSCTAQQRDEVVSSDPLAAGQEVMNGGGRGRRLLRRQDFNPG